MDDKIKDEELVNRIHRDYKTSTTHLKDWFVEAEESMRVTAGDSWPEEDRIHMESLGRTCVSFNRVAPFVDAVVGMEVNNRKEVRYLPREQGDIGVNELLTSAVEWVRDESDAEDEESQAFGDMLTTGYGWIESGVCYLDEPDGEGEVLRRDPFRMRYDPSASKRNLTDAGWMMHIDDMDKDEVRQLWPDAKIEDALCHGPWDADIDDLFRQPDQDIPGEDAYLRNDGQTFQQAKGKIRVARYQYTEFEPVIRVATEQGGEQFFSPEQWTEAKNEFDALGMRYKQIRQTRRKVRQAFVMGNTLLEKGPAPCDDLFSFSPITGKFDPIKGYYYGLVRVFIDPQRWANVLLSTVLDVMKSNSKGGVNVETDAVPSVRKFEETWADPTAVVWFNPGALAKGKVQERGQASFPAGLDRIMNFAIQSFPDVSGINMEVLGLAGREQAGIVETQRKQSGLTILAWAFDSLRRYRKHQGRVMASLITTYLADGRLIRVTGKQGDQQYLPLLRDKLNFKYDVIVDEAPTSPNQKERTFQVLTELLPSLQAMGIPLPPSLLRFSPLPESLTQEWLQYIQQSQENPEATKAAQARADQEEAKVEEIKGKAHKAHSEAEQTDLENQILQHTGMMP